MKVFLTIALFTCLLACTTVAPNAQIPPGGQDTCNAAPYANLIGQDATALERVLLLGQVRIIRPGQQVTKDFRPERINFNIGPEDRIVAITCT